MDSTNAATHVRKRSFVRFGVVIAFIAAYVAVVFGYTVSIQNAGVYHNPAAPHGGVALGFVPTTADPALATLTGVLYVIPSDELVDEGGRLSKELTVDVLPTIGAGSTTFKVGQTIATMNVVLDIQGDVRNYPFDTYSTAIITSASVRDSANAPWETIPVAAGASGELTGWKMSLTSPDSVDIDGDTFKTSDDYGIEEVHLERAESTVVIAMVVILLMTLLAMFAVLVSRAFALGKKKFEPGLTGWMAAMLFALIPLRNFLPGAPPLGSWIDILVVFWVQIVIMASLAWYVGRWLRMRPTD